MRLLTSQYRRRKRIPKGEVLRLWHEKYKREATEASKRQEQENVTSEVIVQPSESNFYEFEPGMYDAVVTSIESIPNTWPEAKSDTQLQWEFTVPGYENDDGTPATRRGWCNPVWNPKAKLWKWAQAILGETPKADEPFRTSVLIDKPCRIVLNLDEGKIKLTDVLGPAKSAPVKKGLAASVKANPPAGTTVAESIGACVLCGEPGTKFTGKGAPICEECS